MTVSDGSRWLQRARRLLAIQAALGVVLGVVLVGAVTYVVVLSRQDAELHTRLERASAAADVADPPPGVWVVSVDTAGLRRASSLAPAGLPYTDQVEGAREKGEAVVEEVHASDGNEYLTRTDLRGGVVVQAGLDFGPRDAERSRLLLGLGAAGALGTITAALAGMWISRRAMEPLEEAMSRQRRFVADASHELRTPLARLTLRAQMLQRATRNGVHLETVDEDAARLVAEAKDMSAIIEDLLLSAQLEKSPLEGKLVDLGRIATHVVAADQHRAADREVTLTAHAGSVPPVRGVAVALTRAVNALVDNALSHAPEGGHVDVTVGPGPGGTVTLAVCDDGPGIDPESSERIFERFARGHDRPQRFGLGLALAREVVEAHGGSVTLDTTHTSGARFVVSIPQSSAPSPSQSST